MLEERKREETGAISTLVLFTVLMFVLILTATYLAITTMQKSQLKSDIRIQEIYGEKVNNVDEVYNELTRYVKYDEPYIPTGFTHTEGEWNSGYTIKDEEGNEFVWVPCVTDQSKVKEGDEVVTFKRTLPEDATDTTDQYYKYNQYNMAITGEQQESAEEIEKSVDIYGGFYIAKYEAGIEEITDNYSLNTKTATDGSVKPLSQKGKGLWNYITRENAIQVSEVMIDEETTGAKSALISGAAWDTTLQWMVNTSDNKVINAGYDINSNGKGWYKDVSYDEDTSTYTRHLTGYYAVNNIYDMAGNVWEWTTENCINNGNSLFTVRGGNYDDAGSYSVAAMRASSSVSKYIDIGFRVVLYK